MKKYSAAFIVVTMLASTLALSPAARADSNSPSPEFTVVCTNASVAPFGGFNQDAICPTGYSAGGGGYQLTDTFNGNILNPVVGVNIFHFTNVTPDGWQTIGVNPTGESATIRVCASCAQADQQRH